MSDLQCAARVLVARHAEAAFVEDDFSDEGGSLTSAGRAQAEALAEGLAAARVRAIWCSDSARSVQTAEIVAARLGVPVTVRKTLREVDVGELAGHPFDKARLREMADRWRAGDLDAGFPGGESGREVLERYRAQLEEIADLHRGESVLVVAHETALGLVVPALAGHAAAVRDWDNTAVLALSGDADGWVLDSP
ncbi:MAG TPA: histidine phosphatase family protein [Marmoricola sp.]|nr:histidine phosphatase family protein [Marmoricola sp.]